MIFDSLMLRCALAEVRSAALGAHVVDVVPLSSRALVLKLKNRGDSLSILCSVEPALGRLVLAESSPSPKKLKVPFALEVKRRLLKGRLFDVHQHGFERLARLRFQVRDELGELVEYELVAELTGRNSNLFLLDAEKRITAVLQPASATRTGLRHLVPGAEYTLPPGAEAPAPDAISFDDLRARLEAETSRPWPKALRAEVTGMSTLLLRELALRADLEEELAPAEFSEVDWRRLEAALAWLGRLLAEEKFEPVAIDLPEAKVKCYPVPLLSLPAEVQRPVSRLGPCVEAAAYRARRTQREQALRTRLQALVREALKRTWRALEEVSTQLEAAGDPETFKRCGDLLLVNAAQLQNPGEKVVLEDPATGEPVSVTLDPRLSIPENAAQYYKRYKRAKRALELLPKRLQALKQRAGELERFQVEVEQAEDLAALQALQKRLPVAVPPAARSSARQQDERFAALGINPRSYTSPGGFEVLVGRNAKENDLLTFKVAQPKDLWFHCRGEEGAHVVLRTGGRPQSVQKSDLIFAAALAAAFSREKHSALAPVDYTERRYVRKIKGAGPGAAAYSREKTLFVKPATATGPGR